jgi:uncharacterized protein (DUF2237 family)
MGNSHKKLKNVYGEPLKSCAENYETSGSWDAQGFCSEKGGGVHTICVNKISKNAKNFSSKTGQSNWSDNRGNNNHCVCLGAWSLYSAKENNQNSNVLKCDAIPEFIFSHSYYNDWDTWNGKQKPNQIENGLDNLYNICENQADGNEKKLKTLNKNYRKLKKKIEKEKNYK